MSARLVKPRLADRAAGMLLHATSLPGARGVGDLGAEARRFADFLSAAGLGWWQMLPVGPVGPGHSPYSSASSFAGSPLLISLEDLAEDGLLEPKQLELEPLPEGRADYARARELKERLLRAAFARFSSSGAQELWSAFRAFLTGNADWVEDYSLFEALKEERPGVAWTDWEPRYRFRRFKEWGGGVSRRLGEAAAYHQFVQFLFQRQWSRLRSYAAARGISLIGDVPIFAALDSADVWARPEIFDLASDARPRVVSGVPPDYFSRDGQLWGNPHYRWDALEERGYDWWLARLRSAASRFDAARLDHFIGFSRYWEIPAGAATAREGRWVEGPGAKFFDSVLSRLEGLELIAEDLGSVTSEVLALRDRFKLPGMKVLQFAFGQDVQAESFLPHNYVPRCVAYTGTHDNDTTRGWFEDPGEAGGRSPEQAAAERSAALGYLKSDGRAFHWDMIRAVLESSANTAIVPAQDVLGLGSQARMNRPGLAEGNWEWRLTPGALDRTLAGRMREALADAGRLPEGGER